ncbi:MULTISPECIES: methyltransferase [Pseudomonas]|uniref:SAM-dependent methyltransferase n=1 Tax=Pseudomonas guariconensis TaxID=1288410 RepID=A0AAX0VUS2_9PSED|nr:MULTISPECIES: class I SAM-dependent methyltransferase [Pseudomonas]MBH3358276.1 class I SAM-dependent methyltransferase [Pseudomonas guariconensis]MDM9594175.1 class I SAM-dependent methyltransferase [Pseudomonas guariconensis]MDM9607002.1 class I SAM-dependent methyltransferase [Pseudomonas guariconensis]MDM9611958.1 class I SAM-dependent methyltransferase [Pseudomonas guariconensis]MEB3841115.1 class I SAM-dependent methyltransferase [Pseudomonas guariconensis]
MQLNPEQVQADQALLQLGRRLRADGYRFTCVTPATHARNNAREGSERARTLRDVFGWSRPFAPGLISADELQQLQAAQVLTGEGDLLRSTVRWSSLDDLLLVHSAFPTDASDAVFFGPDSYRFAQVIHDHLQRTPKPVQHAVDIGCGTGVGALLIARAAQHAQVSAVDINPLALRYTAINAALAGVGNLSVEPSDLLDGISGTFDLIVANPPYMLDASERVYRHGGGALGAQLSLRIVEQACERLSPAGTLLLYTGVAIVEGRDALLEAIRLRLAGPQWSWVYREVDPDVFGEQLLEPGYERVERIAAVALTVTRNG